MIITSINIEFEGSLGELAPPDCRVKSSSLGRVSAPGWLIFCIRSPNRTCETGCCGNLADNNTCMLKATNQMIVTESDIESGGCWVELALADRLVKKSSLGRGHTLLWASFLRSPIQPIS